MNNLLTAVQTYLIGKEIKNGNSYESISRLYELNYIEEEINYDLITHSLAEQRDPISGRKIKAERSLDEEGNLICVSEEYTDILSIDNKLEAIQVDYVWYAWREQGDITDENNNIVQGYKPLVEVHRKTKLIKLSRQERHKIRAARREARFDYLLESAEGTALEDYVNILLAFYEKELSLFIKNATSEFYEKVNNGDMNIVVANDGQNDITIGQLLNTVADTDTGDTLKDVINSRLLII